VFVWCVCVDVIVYCVWCVRWVLCVGVNVLLVVCGVGVCGVCVCVCGVCWV